MCEPVNCVKLQNGECKCKEDEVKFNNFCIKNPNPIPTPTIPD